jgi:sigma-B regulation protein RsbQ
MTAFQRHNATLSGSAGKIMMLAHGFGCDQNMWRFVAPAFADDYRLLLFDHIGAGASAQRRVCSFGSSVGVG